MMGLAQGCAGKVRRRMVPRDWPWGKTCRVPAGLSRERLERWCDLKTQHDARLAATHDRAMSAKQFARRLTRRRARAGLDVTGEPGSREG